jgi:hypothetical protein
LLSLTHCSALVTGSLQSFSPTGQQYVSEPTVNEGLLLSKHSFILLAGFLQTLWPVAQQHVSEPQAVVGVVLSTHLTVLLVGSLQVIWPTCWQQHGVSVPQAYDTMLLLTHETLLLVGSLQAFSPAGQPDSYPLTLAASSHATTAKPTARAATIPTTGRFDIKRNLEGRGPESPGR